MSEILRPPPAWFRAARAVIRRLPAGRFRAFETLARVPLAPFVDRLGGQAGGMAYRCDLRDLVAREMCLTGGYAPLEAALVRRALPAGGTFVDVGANLGYFTLFGAARVGSAGRVVALEPHPRIAAVLRANVAMNALANVQVREVAASDAAGTATLSGFSEDGGNWGVSSITRASSATGPSFQVPCAPLDQVLDGVGIDAMDLVKVDVEGAEGRVLRGMRDGLHAGRYRRVMVELHPWEHADFAREFAAMSDAMRAAGYRGWLVEESAEAARRAYYGAAAAPSLRPLDDAVLAGTWPHVLWTLPGMEIA
ncbi:FkbM family methyltransferase [Longimicrobium sp.]|uniref:FkbM family methyltransferase n=1 Tax=Longimicrobium sp. TaxID=2029185 RepID=UPI003B3BB220